MAFPLKIENKTVLVLCAVYMKQQLHNTRESVNIRVPNTKKRVEKTTHSGAGCSWKTFEVLDILSQVFDVSSQINHEIKRK